MKNLLFLITFVPFGLFSQNVKIKWGKEHSDKKVGFYSTSYLDTEDNHHYFLQKSQTLILDKSKSKYRITKVNFKGDVVDEYKSDLLKGSNSNQFSKTLIVNNKTYVLSSRINKSSNKFELSTSKFLQGKFSSPIVFYEHAFNPKDGTGNAYSYGLTEFEGETKFSTDSTIFVFGNQIEIADRKKEKDKINLAIFNDQFDLIWEKVQEFPYNDSEFYANNIEINNAGTDVFISGALRTDKKNNFFDYKIFHITQSSLVEYNIEVDQSHLIQSMAIYFDEESKVLRFTGLFNIKKSMELDGVYSGMIELNKKIVRNLEFTSFSKTEKSKFSKRKERNQKFNIINCKKFENGTFQVIAENSEMLFRHFDKRSYGQDFFSSPDDHTRIFTKAELIVYLLDKDGKLITTEVIIKKSKQESSLSSVEVFYDNKITYLIFETKIGKAEKKKYGVKGFLYPITLLVTINENGVIQSSKLLSYIKKDKFAFISREVFVHNGHVFYGGSGQKTNEGALIGTGVRRLRFGNIPLD